MIESPIIRALKISVALICVCCFTSFRYEYSNNYYRSTKLANPTGSYYLHQRKLGALSTESETTSKQSSPSEEQKQRSARIKPANLGQKKGGATSASPYIRDLLLGKRKGRKRRKRKNKVDFSIGAAELSRRGPGEKPIVFKALWRRVVQPWVPTVRWGALIAPRMQKVVKVLPQPALIGMAALCANEVTQREIKRQIHALPPTVQPGAYGLLNDTLQNLGDRLDYLAQQGWKVDALFMKEVEDLKRTGIQRSPETEAFIKEIIEGQILQVLAVDENITSVLKANTTSTGIYELQKIVPSEYKQRICELGKLVEKIESGKESITFEDIFKIFVEKDAIREPLKLLQAASETMSIIRSLELEFYDENFYLSSNVYPQKRIDLRTLLAEKATEAFEFAQTQAQKSFKESSDNVVKTVEGIVSTPNFELWKKQLPDFIQNSISEAFPSKVEEKSKETSFKTVRLRINEDEFIEIRPHLIEAFRKSQTRKIIEK